MASSSRGVSRPKEAWARPASRVRAHGVRPTPPQLPVPIWARRLRQQREAETRRETAEQKGYASWQLIKNAFDAVADNGARAVDEVGLTSLLALLAIPIEPQQLSVVMRQMQAGPDGRVGFDGFAAWYIRTDKQRKLEELERIREAFDSVDRGGSGALDKNQVAKLSKRLGARLKSLYSSKNLNAAWSEMDPNGDGRVVFDEFRDWWVKRHERQKAEHVQAQLASATKRGLDSDTRTTRWKGFSLTTFVSVTGRLRLLRIHCDLLHACAVARRYAPR